MSGRQKWFSLRPVRATCIAGLLSTLTGCSHSPTFNVLGSYFPGWIACILLSVIATALIRLLLSRLRWEQKMPALPLLYLSMTLLIACSIWLIAFE